MTYQSAFDALRARIAGLESALESQTQHSANIYQMLKASWDAEARAKARENDLDNYVAKMEHVLDNAREDLTEILEGIPDPNSMRAMDSLEKLVERVRGKITTLSGND